MGTGVALVLGREIKDVKMKESILLSGRKNTHGRHDKCA
jgi:hypothetical protein